MAFVAKVVIIVVMNVGSVDCGFSDDGEFLVKKVVVLLLVLLFFLLRFLLVAECLVWWCGGLFRVVGCSWWLGGKDVGDVCYLLV